MYTISATYHRRKWQHTVGFFGNSATACRHDVATCEKHAATDDSHRRKRRFIITTQMGFFQFCLDARQTGAQQPPAESKRTLSHWGDDAREWRAAADQLPMFPRRAIAATIDSGAPSERSAENDLLSIAPPCTTKRNIRHDRIVSHAAPSSEFSTLNAR